MGLRLWKDPEDDMVIAENAAAKLDRAAAARRSTIRRETSIRPGRDHVPPQSISVFLRSRHQSMLRTRDRLRQEERETDSQIAQLQAELERLRRMRLRNRVRLNEELDLSHDINDLPEPSPPLDQPTPDENVGSNPETSQDPSRQPPPRSSRESNLRFELLPSSVSRSSSPWRYQVLSRTSMPSPPRSSGSDRRDTSIPDGPIPGDSWLGGSNDDSRMPALTEGFAPARAGSHSASQHPQSQSTHQYSLRLDDDFRGLETPPPESWESSYPPLQRVGHNSPRPILRVDGLGDRRRSMSPLSPEPHDEEDTWMSTLLATMDTSRSSSASSFTSSSHNSTNTDPTRRSNLSSQTTATTMTGTGTSTSFGEIGSLDDTCDLDLPEGITEADVRTIRERHFSSSSSGRSGSRFSNREIRTVLRALREHMDRVGNTEFGMFQAILTRMQRREPIPQEWWVTVGLPEDFGRGMVDDS